jgi:misacylated tRNA(Ala) deacylase
VEGGADLPSVGTPVHGALDWPRRYALMRHHTAVHVLGAVASRVFGEDVRFTGGQLYPDRARVDLEFREWKAEFQPVLEQAVNEELARDHPVSHATITREEFEKGPYLRTKENLLDPALTSIRLTIVGAIDAQADGGTHVRSTREVGRVRIVKVDNKGKGHRRLTIELEPKPGT